MLDTATATNVRDHLHDPLTRPLRIAVVGLGGRGTIYCRLVAAADAATIRPEAAPVATIRPEAAPVATVVQIAEPRPELRDRMGAELDLGADARFTDWRDLVAGPRLADVVVIAVQDQHHLEAIEAFASAGYDILCEKPIAGSQEQCVAAVAAAAAAGVFLGVCHVLRYTPTTQRIRALIGEGAIGDIVAIHHLEPVGFFHFAHSFVRGAWRREDTSGPMLLTKACHDLDWLSYIVGSPAARVSSFGSLAMFDSAHRPDGASDRCATCDVEPDCAYSAARLYRAGLVEGAPEEYFTRIVAPQYTAAAVEEALLSGPYGRCAYECDNDVVDHQVVNVEYANGVTAAFTVTAFSPMEHRRTSIFGTAGQITTDGRDVELYDFLSQSRRTFDVRGEGGHGGGDAALVSTFLDAMRLGEPDRFSSQGAESLQTHQIVFAAERARRTNTVVSL